MKDKIKQVFALKNLVIFFVLLWGFTMFSSFLEEYTRPKVQAVQASKSALSIELQANAKLDWQEQIAVFSDFDGVVTRVLASEGEEVTVGTELFQVNGEKLEERLQDLENKQAEWRMKLMAAKKRQVGFFAEEKTNIEYGYVKELADAELNAKVKEQLYELGTVSKSEWDEAQLALDKKRAEQTNVWASLQEREAQLYSGRVQAERELKKTEEDLARVRALVEEGGMVRAKQSGVLSSFSISVGTNLQNGALLYELGQESEESEADFLVDKKVAAYVKTGDTVNMKHVSVSGSFQGTILSIRPDRNNPDNRQIKVRFPSWELPPGSEVELDHVKRTKSYEIVVPKAAVGTYQNQKFVWVVEEKTKGFGTELIVKRHAVVLGESDAKNVVITSGLSPQDYFVSRVLNEKALDEESKVTWEREDN